MKARKFELFMGCLGNGIAVCNKAVMEHGDYKYIAHISDNGKIKWYVSDDYTPEPERKKIEQVAADQRTEFLKQWNRLPTIRKYEKLLDMLPMDKYLEVCKDKENTMEQKVEYLEKEFI